MRVVVTGGTGRVGWFIAQHYRALGWEVTATGRDLPLAPETDHAPLLAGADLLVHCAFAHAPGRYRGGEGDDPAGFRRANLDGTTALFHAARSAGVRRVVFLSTRAVYGPHAPGTWLVEDMPCHPDTLYGEVKLAAERALAQLSGPGFAGVSLRVTGVYGPTPEGVPHKWADLFRDFREGRPIAPRAGTEVHGQDVARAVELVAGLKAPAPVYNVSDLLLDRRELLKLTGLTGELPEAADVAQVNQMDTGRLTALGWQPGGVPLLRETLGLLTKA